MMTRKVSISSVKASLSWLRRLAAALILFFAAQGVWGQQTYTNPTNATGWSNADTASFTNGITCTLAGDAAIGTLQINAGTNTVTIDLGGHTLTVGTLNLGIGNNSNPGHLQITNGTVFVTTTFDECDDANNTLNLTNVNFTVTGQLYCNGSGTTEITGTGSTFTTPATYTGYDGSTSSIISFPGSLQPITSVGNYSVTTSGQTGPGKVIEIIISNSTDTFDTINFNASVYGSGTYTYSINDSTFTAPGTITATGTGSFTQASAELSMTVYLKFPDSIPRNSGIQLVISSADPQQLGTPVFYTQQSNETEWSGATSSVWNVVSNWSNGIPAAGMDVTIPSGLTNYPLITSDTNNLNSITNNGTITFSGGSISATTKANGDGSTIIYDGLNSAVWGNSYENLVIAYGTSISLGAASIAGDATNNGTLTITDNNFSVIGTKTNGGSSTIIYSGVTSTPWELSYQNLEIASGTSISLGAANIAGTATNNGTLTITSNSFSAGIKANGPASTIIYSGTDFTSAPWGLLYQNLEIANGTSITLGAVTIAGTATNNGTLTITSDSFSAGTTSNGTQNSTIIYNGVSNPVWGYDYKNLTVSSGTITFANPVSISGTAANNGTINIISSMSAGTISGTGTITLAGSGGATTLTATNASTQGSIVLDNTAATIIGDFSLTSFTATNATSMAGKSITLNNSTITASSISLSGANSSPLLLNGGGTTHEFNTSSLTAGWLSIDSNIVLTNYTTAISNSVPQADNSLPASWLTVMHHGWNIKELSYFTYTWVGTTSDWNTASNWDTGYVPVTDSRIIIPAVTTPKVYPVLPDTADFPGGTLSIAANASIQLGSKNLVLSGTDGTGAMPANPILTNSGTIIYTNAGRITNSSSTPINDAAHGTVEYQTNYEGIITHYSDGSSDDYNNLTIYGNKWKLSGNLKLNTITLGDANAVCNITDDTLLQAASFVFNGKFSIAVGKNVTLAPYDDNSDFVIPAVMNDKFDFKADNAGENKGWVYLGKEGYSKTIIFNNAYLLSYKIKLNSKATLNANLTVRNSVTATDEINGDGVLIIDGSGTQKITLASGKTYNTIQITKDQNNAKSKVTFYNSGYTISSLTFTNGKETIFDGSPFITTCATTANCGNITFSDGATITNGFTQTAGTTTVKGTVSTTNSAFSVKDLILSDNAQITTGTGAQTYTTINGTAGTEELTLSGSSITLNGNVGETKKLAQLIFDGTLLIGADCSIKADEIDYSADISGSGNILTITTPVFKSTVATSSTAEINLGKLVFGTDTSVQTQNASIISFTVLELGETEGGKEITLATSGSTYAFTGDVEIKPAFVTSTGTTFKASSGSMTFKSDLDITNGNFDANSGTVILSPSSTSMTLSGSSTFNNLTASGLEGKTITFANGTTQTVNGELKLSGTDNVDNKRLVLTGTGWTITAGTHTIQYVDVENSSATNTLTALNSYDRGHNDNWNFPGMTYKWTGSNDATHGSEWHFAANWIPASIPGSGANVTIPVDTDDDFKKGLVLEADVNIQYGSDIDKGIITVDGTFDMAGSSVTAAKITNNGLVKLIGKTNQLLASMENGNTSTVEYYSSGFESFAWDGGAEDGKQYNNLILSDQINWTTNQPDAEALVVAGLTTIKAGSAKTVVLDNVNNVFENHVKCGDYTNSVNAGTVTLAGKGNGTAAIYLEDNLYAQSLVLNSNVQGDTITINAPLTLNSINITATTVKFKNNVAGTGFEITGATVVDTAAATTINTSGNQTYNGSVTLNKTTSFTAPTVNFNGNVSNTDSAAMNVQGAVNIDAQSITTTGAVQTYSGLVTVKQSATLTATQVNYSDDIVQDGTGKTLVLDTPILNSTKTGSASAITVGTVKLARNVSLQADSTGGINLTADSITQPENSDFALTNNTTLAVSNGIQIYTDFINAASKTLTAPTSGSITFKGDVTLPENTFVHSNGTVILSPSSASMTLSGSSTFNNLTASGLGGKTFNIASGSTQTVNGTLTLTGTKQGETINYLTIKGTESGIWNIYCANPTDNHSIQYVAVYNANNNASPYYLTALDSQDWGGNIKWNFPAQRYKWTGSTDATHGSEWHFAANWIPASIPGSGANVTIPVDTDPEFITGLVLEADVNIQYPSATDKGIITVEGTFDMAGSSVTAAEVINKNLVRATGVTGQSITGKMTNGTTTSTVEYYGTGSNNLFWNGKNTPATDKQYENLHIDQAVNPWDNAIEARGDIVIDKAVTLGGSITASTITANAAFTYNGSSISTSGAQTYVEGVTISATPSFASSGGLINFQSTVTGTAPATSSLTITTGNSQFDGVVSNLAELTTAAATINCATVATSGNQTYGGAVTIKAATAGLTSSGGNISFAGTVAGNTGTEALTLGAATVTFGNTVTALASLDVNGASTVNTNTITTSGAQSYSGTINFNQNAAVNASQITFGTNISGDGETLIINTPSLISSISAGDTPAVITLGQLVLSQNMEISSENAADLNLVVTKIDGENKKLTFAANTKKITLKDGIEIIPDVENKRTVECAGAATFKGTFTNTNGTITGDTINGKTLAFEKSYSGTGYMTASKGTTVFKADIDLSGTSFTHSSGTVQFNGNGTVQSLVTQSDGSTHFYSLTVSSPAKVNTSSSFYVDGTTWANTTEANGFTAGSPSQITFINSSITIGGKNKFNIIEFPTASQTASITDSNVFGPVIVSGTSANLSAENTQNEFNDIITIGSASVAAGNISLKAKTTLNFAANFNCNSATLNAGANAVTFNGNATYNTSFVNNGTAPTNFLTGFTGNGNATFVHDAIFKGTTGTSYQLSCPDSNLIKCRNFVLYSGNYTFGGKLETTGDVIILGTNYIVDDSQTGVSNVFVYNQTRLSQIQFTGAFPAASSLSGTITVNANANIKVGKNFYANGTSLQGNSDWYIQLPATGDAAHGFAEAINTIVKNCKVSCWETPSNTATDDTAPAKVAAYECTDNSGNTNWYFEDFEIIGAYTIRDNAVYVEFNAPVRNLHNEVNNSVSYLTYKGTTTAQTSFSGIYSDPDCQNAITNSDVNLTDGKYRLYLKAPDTWNTDATGKTLGEDGSTDRNGAHKTSIPYLDIPRSLGTTTYIITNKWGKRLNNYSTRTPTAAYAYGDSADLTNEVLDRTGPVLYSVRTGQELHDSYDYLVGEASEHSYDAHNFIEFRYSEPVDFDGDELTNAPLNADPATAENVQVTDSFGAIAGNITTEGSLTIAGIGVIESGLIHTGRNGSTDKYVNAFYRKDPYSIRLSVAGYTDGTVTDNNSYTFKNWTGYIEQAVQPTGTVVHLVDSDNKNTYVRDKSADQNPQLKYAANNTIPEVNANTSASDASYGNWDVSEPVFAIIRQSRNREWSQEEFDKTYQAEAIGNTSGVGSTLDRIEFHVYDNTPFDPLLVDQPEWFTEVGWCAPGSNGEKSNDLYKTDSYAADVFGGARPFLDNSALRTSGGLRYSTLRTSASAFKYGVGTGLSVDNISNTFNTTLFAYGGASSLIFTGTSNPRRSAGDLEGLYFALPLENTSYDIKTSFTVHYDEAHGFITDLAGNRLRSKTISTIDRTPPAIDMTITPIGKDEVEIVFVKELCIESNKLNFIDNSTGNNVNITETFESLITQCFDIITIDASGAPSTNSSAVDLAIDTNVPAKVWVEKNSNDSSFTHIKMKLTRAVTLEDLTKYYLRVKFVEKYGEYSVDLFTQHAGSRVTFIQDENGNTIQMYTAHALSDFAVGEVTPLYAYDSSMVQSDGTIISGGLWHTDTSDDVDTQSWAVHDWNRDQQNYGTLPAGHTVAIVADTASAANVNVYLANTPDEKSVSTQANKDFEFTTPWRIWLPDVLADVFTPLSEKNNTNYSQVSGSLLDGKTNRFIFDVNSSVTDLWSAGDQVSFLFGITNADGTPVTIMHSPELDINNDKHYLTTSTKMPLFALRQLVEDDFLSLDLWSFRLKSLVTQRGGVTILNNVIDSAQGEKVVVRVDLPQEANLTVLVMTLDGNIVDYLERGTASKGEHYYSWDGSNRSGKPVARGMYFIRVMSDGIDETRKVLVVKE